MRTTIDIPDGIFRELKVKAAREGKTFREIALRAIQRELEGVTAKQVKRFEIPVIRSEHPGTLDLTNEQIDELTAFT